MISPHLILDNKTILIFENFLGHMSDLQNLRSNKCMHHKIICHNTYGVTSIKCKIKKLLKDRQ